MQQRISRAVLLVALLALVGAPARATDSGPSANVREGDLYGVLTTNLILNLNRYAGLQVIDFSDVENPRVIGRLQLAGYPVEMYAAGQRAILLLNAGGSGRVLVVDLSDPTRPRVAGVAAVPGWIVTSRLVEHDGEVAALYVATGGYVFPPGENGGWRTFLRSFEVSDGTLRARTALTFGGFVVALRAVADTLLVARTSAPDVGSDVAVVDVSDPAGVMRLGGHVHADGHIRDQFNMDLTQGVLRVFSGQDWGTTRTNYLQTWDATDFENLTPIDRATFGSDRSLNATLLLRDRAFANTGRGGSFHAFALGTEGHVDEIGQAEVCGWDDFYFQVYRESRLIAIGVDDAGGRRTVAVSLYDITDLGNPEPLLGRRPVEADRSWSEASFDHRAVSVLEDAVAVPGPSGVIETGLVLLPFDGYNSDGSQHTMAVQIMTFSKDSLTRRGLMVHGTPARRSFPVRGEGHLVANLSDKTLGLFDTSEPDEPRRVGEVRLWPPTISQ